MAQIIDGKTIIENEQLEFLASELRNGKIFILPTSTIYGICTNALNEKAVQKIFNIKKRARTKPLIVLVNNFEMLKKLVVNLNDIQQKLINKFWPGSLTIVFKKSNLLPNIVTANKDSVAVRMDSADIIKKIIDRAGVPIVAPSANIAGNKNINNISDLEQEIFEKVDYIIDIGSLKETQESTLIKVKNNEIILLREGKIKREEIFNFFIS